MQKLTINKGMKTRAICGCYEKEVEFESNNQQEIKSMIFRRAKIILKKIQDLHSLSVLVHT
jgi:hypothetical protein